MTVQSCTCKLHTTVCNWKLLAVGSTEVHPSQEGQADTQQMNTWLVTRKPAHNLFLCKTAGCRVKWHYLGKKRIFVWINRSIVDKCRAVYIYVWDFSMSGKIRERIFASLQTVIILGWWDYGSLLSLVFTCLLVIYLITSILYFSLFDFVIHSGLKKLFGSWFES